MKPNLDTLNANQRSAVEWTAGPLLVLAGPGSGKTLVLTLRAARILQDDPEASMLALSFTTKAADEMRQRLDALMGSRADRAHLCTFHSFAGDVLRQHGSHVGIRPDFSMLANDDDRIAVLEEVIGGLSSDKSGLPTDRKNLLFLLDRLFAESYNGEPTAPGMTTTPPWIPPLFKAYCERLQASNRLDFGALLHFARMLLSSNAGVARLTRLAWQYISVDEFQDTNKAQYDLLSLLAVGDSPNLFVVADDDQIIYQWNGASPERLLALRSDFGMDVIQLPENFRCPPIIIQLANSLIGFNQTRSEGKKPLVANKVATETPALKAQAFNSEEEEAANVPKVITDSGWRPEECAVLARNAKLLDRAANALTEKGLQPFVAKRKTEFESPAVRWLFNMLRLANGRHDRVLLGRVCVAWNELTGSLIELEDVEAEASLGGGDFLRAWVNMASSKEPKAPYAQLLTQIGTTLVDRIDFLGLLESFWAAKYVDDDLEAEEIATWKEQHASLTREHAPENMTLHLYLQEMDLKSKAPAQLPGSVRCLTVHGSKGMEFKHVFLIGMADEVFPSYQATKKGPQSKEMEEERRNCFVAITRAEETLNISWSRAYNGYPKRPSRFLEEMGFKFKKPGS
ncbi:MAG TPA: ATP-dependent helicase [Candidatus Acidoferrales bacterium]|nr:ATP-dependent helicase [Candidatus Acidoferrales bacterium]